MYIHRQVGQRDTKEQITSTLQLSMRSAAPPVCLEGRDVPQSVQDLPSCVIVHTDTRAKMLSLACRLTERVEIDFDSRVALLRE